LALPVACLRKSYEGKLDAAQASALQATLASTTAVAAQQGMLGSEVQRAMKAGELIPAWFAQNTYVGTENARVLHAAGTGEIDPLQALDEMADVAAAAVTRTALEVCKEAGGKLGEMLAKGVPWAGHLISPFGRRVGEFLGEKVGEFVGSTAGQAIREGVEKVKDVARAVVSKVADVAERAYSAIKSIFSL
jgi:nitrogenase molybdenum-iron protein alpha/beta subunit